MALGYLLDNQYDKAEVIYRKWKGKKFNRRDKDLADTIFLKDIAELEAAGIEHPYFQRVKHLFTE